MVGMRNSLTGVPGGINPMSHCTHDEEKPCDLLMGANHKPAVHQNGGTALGGCIEVAAGEVT